MTHTHPYIINMIERYRGLKSDANDLKAEMDKLKGQIGIIVDADGNWKDDTGYARRITKNDSISYSGDLDGLAHVWAASSDPTIKMCGDVVLTHRTVRRGSSYIQVK